MLGGKPDSLVLLTNSQGDSDWVSLVQAACDQGLLSTGDLCLNSNGEKLIFVSCIRDKTNPTDLTQPTAGISDASLKLLLVTTMVLLLKF